jgi:hypothetical protein
MASAIERFTAIERVMANLTREVAVAARLAGFDLTGDQALLLARIDDWVGPQKLLYGVAYFGLNLDHNLTRLAAGDLILRRPSPRDRRSRLVEITAAGRGVRALVRGVVARSPELAAIVLGNGLR